MFRCHRVAWEENLLLQARQPQWISHIRIGQAREMKSIALILQIRRPSPSSFHMPNTYYPKNSCTHSHPTPHTRENFTHEMCGGQVLIVPWCLPHFSLMSVHVAKFTLHMEGISQREHSSGVSHKLYVRLGNLYTDLRHPMSIWVCNSSKQCRNPIVHQRAVPNKIWPRKTGSRREGSQSLRWRGSWTWCESHVIIIFFIFKYN